MCESEIKIRYMNRRLLTLQMNNELLNNYMWTKDSSEVVIYEQEFSSKVAIISTLIAKK